MAIIKAPHLAYEDSHTCNVCRRSHCNHQQIKDMNIEHFREYCLSMGDVTEKNPFGKFARRFDSILVFYILDHMFCFVDMDDFSSVTVKSTPDEIEEIQMRHSSVSKPLNQSLRHWIQLNLDGDIADSEIYDLVKRSYEIVKAKYTPKRKNTEQKKGY